MKFLIVEDEKPNANRLKKIVEQLDSSFQVVDIIDSVAGAVDWFNKNPHPDIV